MEHLLQCHRLERWVLCATVSSVSVLRIYSDRGEPLCEKKKLIPAKPYQVLRPSLPRKKQTNKKPHATRQKLFFLNISELQQEKFLSKLSASMATIAMMRILSSFVVNDTL